MVSLFQSLSRSRSFSVSVISWLWVQGFRSLTLLTEFGPNSGLDDGWALISLCWIGSFNWAWFCFRSLFCVHERLGWHCRVWVQTVTVGLSLFPLTDGSGCWIGSRRIVTDLMWQHWGNLAGRLPEWTAVDRTRMDWSKQTLTTELGQDRRVPSSWVLSSWLRT